MADEEIELLLFSAEDPVGTAPEESDEVITPLPRLQIGILVLVLLAEPICSQCIYPFINQLISELGVTGGDEKKVGYYAGIPILLLGSFVYFSVESPLRSHRPKAGADDGNGRTCDIHDQLISLTADSTNRAQASGLLPLVWAVGVTIGPFAGGSLSRPHERFPALFGNQFWEEYPYLLPCLFSAIFCAFAFIVTWLFLKETVKRHHPLKDGGRPYPDHGHEPAPPLRAILTEPVVLSLANFLLLAFIDIALRALQPLFLATPIHLGGLGMSPPTIGLCLGIFGLLDGAVQGLFFAKVIRRVGLKRLLLWSLLCFVPLFASFPVINHFAREWGRSPAVWALVVLQLAINCVAEMTFKSPRALGSVHGIGQTTASLVRAVGPAMATSLFAYTIQNGWLGGLGVYVVLIAISLSGLPLVCKLPEKAWEHK